MEKDKIPVLTLSEYEEKRIREALDTITPESGPYPEDAEAMFALAQDYEKGDGKVPQSDILAFYWYGKAAVQKDEHGLFDLAQCYENGKGTEKNPQKAAGLYEAAAALGHTGAMNNLGRLYYHGILPKDVRKAKALWEQAAAMGEQMALENLEVYRREQE